MDSEEKRALINNYKAILNDFNTLIEEIPGGALDFTPEKSFWTIREHIIHIMDSEVYGFLRYRASIARPGDRVTGYNEEIWRENLSYKRMKVEKCLHLINLLIEITLDHLDDLIDQNWEAYAISHNERGINTLSDLLEIRISHIESHMQYIKRNNDLYKKHKD